MDLVVRVVQLVREALASQLVQASLQLPAVQGVLGQLDLGTLEAQGCLVVQEDLASPQYLSYQAGPCFLSDP